MKLWKSATSTCLVFCSLFIIHGGQAGEIRRPQSAPSALLNELKPAGRLEDHRLIECSGLDASMVSDDLFWAINDGGYGPYLFALGGDGRHRGRLLVEGAENRDWEDLATFVWRGRPMILIADIGDNQNRYDVHRIYIVEEPRLADDSFNASTTAKIVWKFSFTYPDGRHDAEAVAVDTMNHKVLVLTKRDDPPLLFALPLGPRFAQTPLVARKIAAFTRIPPPSAKDRTFQFGIFRSQPTAMDISRNGRQAIVLTYKDAYLFHRAPHESWARALENHPKPVPLPLPQTNTDLRQREAICFTPDQQSLVVTSEGKSAGIYKVPIK